MAAVAYFFLKGVAEAQTWVFTTLPGDLGFSGEPALWPLLPLTVAGLLVGLTIRYLPGTGGHKPAEGFKAGGPVLPIELPGIAVASFATLSLGVVLGPEAPLIAIGSGLGVLAVHLLKRDAPETAVDGDRCRRQLRSRQHAARIAAGRGVSADGGVGDRRRDDGSDPDPGDARRGSGNPDLRRARQLDRLRHVLAVDPQHPAVHDPHARRVPVGDRDRAGRCRDRHRDQATGAHGCSRSWSGGWWC